MKIYILILLLFTNLSLANDCGKSFQNLTSPVCTKAKYIFWTGTTLALTVRLLKKSYGNELQDQATAKNHLKQFGKVGGDIGYGYLNGLYAVGQLLSGTEKGNQRAEHMIESSLYSLGTTMIIKKSVHESRPGYPDDPDSFPSGHSSFAFAFASVVTANHGWIWGGMAHVVASFIAFSRINDDWHYLHDVLAGATIGMSYGWGVYFNHEEHQTPYWFSVLPTKNLDGAALSFNWNL